MSLVAESTTGVLLSSESVARGGETPEDVGLRAAKLLYRQVSLGGCVDETHQWLAFLYMLLGPEDASKIRFGKLTDFSYVSCCHGSVHHFRRISILRDIRDFFGVIFKIAPEEETVMMSCLGVGYVNMNRKTA